MLLIACGSEMPTEPQALSSAELRTCFDAGPLTLTPPGVVIRVGETATVTATDRFPPNHNTWDIFSTEPSVAIVDGTLASGLTSATVAIKGIAPGEACVQYRVPNFARGYGYGNFGRVLVIEGDAKRRAVRH